MISLKFPENLELKLLIEYISDRLDINVLYDHHVESKRVTIKAPKRIMKESLMGLLISVLRMNGLILVDAEEEGWKRVVADENLMLYCTPVDENKIVDEQDVVSQIIELKHINTQNADQIIRPFLSKPGGNLITIDNLGMIILTDYYSNINRIMEMIEQADMPQSEAEIEFLKVKHLDAGSFANQLKLLLMAKHKHVKADASDIRPLEIIADERTNRLTLIGDQDAIDDAIALADALDVPLDLTTKVYPFKIASPVRVDQLIKNLIGELQAKIHYKSAVDHETNLLVVTATLEIHEQLNTLIDNIDRPMTEEQIPIRFYKLQNAKANEVLKTIRMMEGAKEFSEAVLAAAEDQNSDSSEPYEGRIDLTDSKEDYSIDLHRALMETASNEVDHEGAVKTRVLADKNTNTIIVIAKPSIQSLYAKLIERLDCRRPQVLIEVTLAVLNTSGGYSFGVDLSTGKQSVGSDNEYLLFSSFGLSEIDQDSGSLELIPGVGFNGVVIGGDEAHLAIQALQTEARAKVLSAPRLLINDNATGSLYAVNEVPYTSINASETVATTSFSGYSSAGTTITVTPHISEGDHLSLEYTINLSSFSGEGAKGIPPPRITDEIHSEVTVPNGHTIVIGGLKRFDSAETKESIPYLGDLPFIGPLFSSETQNTSETSLFVFIRPVILRNNEFNDLKYLSIQDTASAGIDDGFPESQPMVIR
jgi:type II secretion system protein D